MPRVRASATTSAARRVLPTPGSPPMRTMALRPAWAASKSFRKRSRSSGRPTNGVRSSSIAVGAGSSCLHAISNRCQRSGKPFSRNLPRSANWISFAAPITALRTSETRICSPSARDMILAAASILEPKRSPPSLIASPVWRPIRTTTGSPGLRRLWSASERWTAISHSTARRAESKATMNLSPIVLLRVRRAVRFRAARCRCGCS